MSKKGYVIPHTHWDREWRYPLWQSRLNLAEMMDELIEILETQPGYKCFLLDGQFVTIEDYLLVRPEKEAALRRLVEDRRILVGPWYTLPDLYPVSGESIVRNLLAGRQKCLAFGARPLTVGYESFGWGQPSQFPQIYLGFGIDTVFVAKNVDAERAPNCEFAWVGKDGVAVYATRLGAEARANFFMHSYMRIMTGQAYKSDGFRFEYGAGDLVCHQAGVPEYEQDYFALTDSRRIHTDNLREIALESWRAMDDTLLDADRVMMDGSDSTTAQPRLPEIVELVNRALEPDGIALEMSGIEQYAKLLKEKLPLETLKKVYGELRDGPPMALSGNALMTRPKIKLLNRKAQSELFDVAEPMSAAAEMLGGKYETIYLKRALEYLLLAHSHDCINGVTQDKTADDVTYRLSQVREIARAVTRQSVRHILKSLNCAALGGHDLLLLAVNPLPYEREEIAEAYVDLPRELDVWDFEILDMDGNDMNAQRVARDEVTTPVASMYARPRPFYADRHLVRFETGRLPAGGYKVYRIAPKTGLSRKIEAWAPNRKTRGREIAVSADRLENERVSVQINGDGSVTVTDKKSGRAYGPLNYFEDTGDAGDYWVYYPPYHNKTFTSKGGAARIWLEENNELQAVARADVTMDVPAYTERPRNYVRGKSERSELLARMEFRVQYTLRKGESFLRVRTVMNNTASDHKVSVRFDTGIAARTADAHGHFCVDRRDALPRRDKDGAYYNEMTAQPMQDFVSVADGDAGFAVLTDSLGDYDISQPGRMSCTLARGVKNAICTEFRSFSQYPSQHGGQSHGSIAYQYALRIGTAESLELLREAKRVNVPIEPVQFFPGAKQCGALPTERSFYAVEGAALSAFKKAESGDGYIMRLYNPKSESARARISLEKPIRAAYLTDMAETRQSETPISGGALEITIGPDKIVTVQMLV